MIFFLIFSIENDHARFFEIPFIISAVDDHAVEDENLYFCSVLANRRECVFSVELGRIVVKY